MKRIVYMLGFAVLVLSLTACGWFSSTEKPSATDPVTSSTSTTITRETTTGSIAVTTTSSQDDTTTAPSSSKTDAEIIRQTTTTVRRTTTVTNQPTTKKTTTTQKTTLKTSTTRTSTTQKTTTTNRSTTTKKTTTTTAPISDYQTEVLRLVNIERQNAGLAPLIYYPAAQAAADTRAAEIHEQWSHTRPNGTSCFTALTDIGIRYRTAGENIAMGYRTPAAVVEGWMNSSGHRANILNENFTHIVIGFNQYGWVQLFITPY